MARIAVGGFQHETNTFAPVQADYERFARQDGWPALCRGAELPDAVDGVHLPIAGALDALRAAGHEMVPLLWCSATPCAHVTEDAFERIAAMLLDGLADAGPVDGVYLDLHGAMVCEHLEDGEGELLRRVRDRIGPDRPLSVSLDLHANVTDAMVEHASVIDLFRTYPHVDMGETGARAAAHLDRLLAGEGAWHKALRRPDFLIPVNWGCTMAQPAQDLYARVPELVGDAVTAVGLGCGFPLADIAECGPAVVAYGCTAGAADAAAEALLQAVQDAETGFAGRLHGPREAVEEALRLAAGARRPVVIADTQDNPGGGGPGDTTGMLRALLEARAEGAVLGLLYDPEAAAAAHRAGEGASVNLALGGKCFPGDSPVEASCGVRKLGDGRFVGTGPMFGGARMALGPMALVETDGVRVALASTPIQAADRSMFRHLGVDPDRESILVLKSSVHFRADFQPIAEAVLIAEAPGPCHADPSKLNFRNLRPGVRQAPRAA